MAPASASACAPYACSGVDSQCATSCVFDSDCAASDYRAVCVAGECVTGRIVFVSSTLFDPSTGITSADAKCNALAQAQGLSGEYRAWMSTNSISASQRIDHSTVPFVLRVGATGRAVLAYDWADLIDGSLARVFDRNEKGQVIATGDYILTGTDRAGATTTKTCANWTTKVGSATYGSTAFLTKNWTEYILGLSCSEPGYIYCFETTGSGGTD